MRHLIITDSYKIEVKFWLLKKKVLLNCSGHPLTYTNWAPDQPGGCTLFYCGEDCGNLRYSDGGRWHDYPCDIPLHSYSFICEFCKYFIHKKLLLYNEIYSFNVCRCIKSKANTLTEVECVRETFWTKRSRCKTVVQVVVRWMRTKILACIQSQTYI